MATYPGTVTRTYITQGASIARGTTIDGYLSDADALRLYNVWKPEWPEMFAFSGGIKAITCEMVLEVPEDEFVKALGGAVGKRIYDISRNNASR